MSDTRNRPPRFVGFRRDELELLFKRYPNPEATNKVLLFVVGALLTPITQIGALLGYVRA